MDEHDDEFADLTIELQQLIASHSPSADSGLRKTASRRLDCIETGISDIMTSLTSVEDVCLLQLNEDEIKGHKADLADLRKELMTLDLEDTDELKVKVTTIEKTLFSCLLELRKQLKSIYDQNN